jgi:thymidylate synthase
MNIPVIQITGKTIADGFEKAIYAVYKNGIDVKTQYDKPEDPPSKDCTLNLTIEEPASDPMIHKAFPGGIVDLREYVYELHGYKDEWVKNINYPTDTRWEYTYHGRFVKYGGYKENNKWTSCFYEQGRCGWGDEYRTINQIDAVIKKLVKQPYTRHAQMITWMPNLDLECYDPPCLQSIWFRLTDNGNDGYWLNTNIRFRSNDAWGASFMNMFGLMQLVKTISNSISDKMQKSINIGRLNFQADSYHIYGKDVETCKKMLINKIDANLPFEKRVYNFYDPIIQEMYTECESLILDKIKVTEDGFRQQYKI